MSDNIEALLKEMARLSLANNTINEIQEKNLKMFPLVFFDGISEVRIEYDFYNNNSVEYELDQKNLEIKYHLNKHEKRKPKVEYFIFIDEKKENTLLDKRYKALEGSVRKLLWLDTKVVIYFNDRLVFESDKNV